MLDKQTKEIQYFEFIILFQSSIGFQFPFRAFLVWSKLTTEDNLSCWLGRALELPRDAPASSMFVPADRRLDALRAFYSWSAVNMTRNIQSVFLVASQIALPLPKVPFFFRLPSFCLFGVSGPGAQFGWKRIPLAVALFFFRVYIL